MNCGVLFPLSSFPSNHGIGDLGKNAYAVIDALANNGANYLQILPFHPSTQANSPYRGVSTFAGDEIYIDLEQLAESMDTKLFKTAIRECVKTKEAQAKKKLLIDYAPKCTTMEDYNSFVEELLSDEKGGK